MTNWTSTPVTVQNFLLTVTPVTVTATVSVGGTVVATEQYNTIAEAAASLRESCAPNNADGSYTVNVKWVGNAHLPWCEQGRD